MKISGQGGLAQIKRFFEFRLQNGETQTKAKQSL